MHTSSNLPGQGDLDYSRYVCGMPSEAAERMADAAEADERDKRQQDAASLSDFQTVALAKIDALRLNSVERDFIKDMLHDAVMDALTYARELCNAEAV